MPEPCVRKERTGQRARLVVEFGISIECAISGVALRDDRRGAVTRVHLHAMRVILILHEINGVSQCGAPFRRIECCNVPSAGAAHTGAQKVPKAKICTHALIRPSNDLASHGLAFVVVSLEQSVSRLALNDASQLPRKVEGILDAGIGSQSVGGGMAMHCITQAEDTPPRASLGDEVVDRTEAMRQKSDPSIGIAANLLDTRRATEAA